MSQIYFEDIFIKFFESAGIVLTNTPDWSPAENFYYLLTAKRPLTKKQALLAQKILEKCKLDSLAHGYDYIDDIKNATWREKFREIDLSKSISLEKDENGRYLILIKFPYALKSQFEELFPRHHHWDSDKKARVIDFYDINLIKLSEFVITHGFDIDHTFIDSLGDVEYIQNNRENFIPFSQIIEESVKLVNAPEDACEWFDKNKGDTLENQVYTAKIMGYPLDLQKEEKDIFEKLVTSKKNNFYISKVEDFFKIFTKISGKCAVLISGSTDAKSWISTFLEFSESFNIPREKIKVCFRETENNKQDFNQWIKENNLGGKVSEGDIYIFQNVLPKWLYSSENSVKIVLTDLVHPATSARVQEWLSAHPCVIYAGEVQPAMSKGMRIEKL